MQPSFTLSSRGYGIDKAAICERELEIIRDDLTVSPRINQHMAGPAQGATLQLYMESSKKIYVPKYYGLKRFGPPHSQKYDKVEDAPMHFTGQLRPEQLDAANNYLHAARDAQEMGGIINVGCGFGKTIVALYLASCLSVRTIIIVHKDFLLEQWKERIAAFLPTVRVGIIKAKTLDTNNKDVVIASLQSLSMKDYDEAIFAPFGFLVVDEVHRTGSEVFSQALKKLNLKYTLGLSATVNRKDGLTKVFKWYIGDIIHRSARKKQHVFVDIREYWNTDPSYHREETIGYSKLNFSRMISNICECSDRTLRIAEAIVACFNDNASTSKLTLHRSKVLVLIERKNHLYAISHEISRMNSAITTGFYIGGMKQSDLQQSQEKDVILATYAFASEGFDAKALDTLVLATPKTDIEQSVGRILRATVEERANVPIVLDFVDQFSIYPNQARKRKAFYKKCGFVFDLISTPPPRDEKSSVGAFLSDEE